VVAVVDHLISLAPGQHLAESTVAALLSDITTFYVPYPSVSVVPPEYSSIDHLAKKQIFRLLPGFFSKCNITRIQH
jgi:hypothetical protein